MTYPYISTTPNRATRILLSDYVLIISCMLVLPSGIIHGLLGLDEKTAFTFVAATAIFLFFLKHRVHNSIPPLILTIILTGAIASTISTSTSQLLMSAVLAVTVVVGRQLFLSLTKPKALRAVSWFALVLLVGALIGIVYSIGGGMPLLEVQVGYRETYLYLTTFSFAFIGNIIRPSGIFDEPGAFSMYVAIVIMFNDTLRQNLRLNTVLAILLVFTGSIAGLVISLLYFLTSETARKQRKIIIAVAGTFFAGFVIMAIAAPSNILMTALDTFYSERLQIVDGRLVGDNRSNQIDEFFRIVDGDILRFGAKNLEIYYDVYDQSSNPFSITYGYGLVISLPYFTLLLWLIVNTVTSRFQNCFTYIGMLIILLQRPYLYSMSWSILVIAAVWLLHSQARQHQARSTSI